MTALLENLAAFIQGSTFLAPVLALAAGILSSLLPCSLSSLPLVLGYVGKTAETDSKRALKLSLTYVLGQAVTFTALGVLASLAGRFLSGDNRWWFWILGLLMVLMALQTWGLFEFIPSTYLVSKNRKRGYVGAVLAGILSGVFSSPCSTPMLVALLAIVSSKGNILWGVILLLCYSIGHGALSVVVGTSTTLVKKLKLNPAYKGLSTAVTVIFGLLILGIGLYMFYLGF